MKTRGVAIGCMLLLLTNACGPEPGPEEQTETIQQTSSDLDVTVYPPLIDPGSVTVTFNFQPPTGWQNFTQLLDTLSKPFKVVSGFVSAVTGGISAAQVVLGWLGVGTQAADPTVTAISDKIDALGFTLTWHANLGAINPQLGALWSALQQIDHDDAVGIIYSQTDGTWQGSLDAMNNLEGPNAIDRPFLRNFDENITNSNTNWKTWIGALPGLTRPVVGSPATLVYDWRLPVAALLKAIPQRNMIIAAAEPNFRTNHSWDNLLRTDQSELYTHYQNMYNGVICGAISDNGGNPKNPLSCNLACADMYTGLSSSKKFLGTATQSMGCQAIYSTADFKYTALEMRTGIIRQLPFFAMRSIIDTLHRDMSPGPDLTEVNQRISLEASPSLCVEVESGNAADGTPLWLAPCNGSTLQWWTYDRPSGRIFNPGLNKCMSALLVNRAAQSTPSWPTNIGAAGRVAEPTGEPVSLYVYPAVITTCNDTLPEQKWTFDPDHKVLQNGSGPDTSLTAATTGTHAALAVRGILGQLQWARPNNQWRVDPTTASVADNHPLLVATGQVFDSNGTSGNVSGGGMALESQAVYWGRTDGTIQKTTLGSTLSPSQIAGGQSAPWATATDAKYVYWTNFSIPGTVVKATKNGDNSGSLNAPKILSSDAGRPAGIAVDANYVFYTTSTYGGGPGTVKRMALDGSGLVTLASGQVDPEYIAIDANNVYWTNYGASGTGTVMKVSKNGGTATVLASGQTSAMDLRLDATNVYWTTNTQILKVPLNGGTPVVLANTTQVPNLAVDSTGVYWVENLEGGTVMTVGLNGGTPTVLAGGLKRPYLALLDSNYVYFATNDSPGRLERVAKTHTNVVTTPAAPAACAPGPAPYRLLNSGQGLTAFTSQSQITTCDGQWWLAMQTDGNLVLYQNVNGAGTPRWASNTVGSFATRAIMQADGNFVLYNESGGAVWQSGTPGHSGSYLATNGAGALAVTNGTTGFWGTATPASPATCGRLNAGEGLRTGMVAASCNGRYILSMQGDGNLVLKDDDTGGALWSSGTSGSQLYAWMTTTALYIYQAGAPSPIWQSNAAPANPNAYLTISDTGIITVYNNEGTTQRILTQTSNTTNVFGSFASGTPYWTTTGATAGQPPVSCSGNSAVNGVGCFGPYCGGVALQCGTPPPGASINTAVTATSAWFSEETDTVVRTQVMTYSNGTTSSISAHQNEAFCGSTGVMTGIECSGSKCDNARITCAKLATGQLLYTAPPTSDSTATSGLCMWTPYYSEEGGTRAFPNAFMVNGGLCNLTTAGYCEFFVNGVECKDSNCDNRRFYLCPVTL